MRLKPLIFAAVCSAAIALAPQTADAAIFSPERKPFGLPVTVHVDGEYVATDIQPVMENNRVFLPMRAAAETMGANVAWDNDARCVTVQKDDITAYFFADSTTYYVNDVAKTSDAAPKIIGGRTMLPIRVFAETLGAQVEWNGNMLDVAISTDKPDQPEPTLPSIFPDNIQNVIQKYYVEPTKPGLGSWYCYTDAGPERIYEILSISEMADGTRYAIVMFGKDLIGDENLDFLTIYSHPVYDYGGNCYMYSSGIGDHIYESDTLFGFTYTTPGFDNYLYIETPQGKINLLRVQNNGSSSDPYADFIAF